MTDIKKQSSEPAWVHILDGSDKEWRLISLYELQKIEHAINEECVGKNDGCPQGHLKEMHDSGNETVDKVRSRQQDPETCPDSCIYKRFAANMRNAAEHDKKVKADGREEALNNMRDAIRNTKKYGTNEPEELFHWTGIVAIIDSLRVK